MSMDKKDVEDNKPIVQPKKDDDSSSDDISKLKQMQADKDESSSEIAKTLSQKSENKQCNDKCSVVIKNIDKGVTETEIRTFLKGCGKIKKISIPKTKKGQLQNLAYVEFCNVADVSIALSLSGASMMNKKVFVFRKKALPRRK